VRLCGSRLFLGGLGLTLASGAILNFWPFAASLSPSARSRPWR
jgi:hypothetical protein